MCVCARARLCSVLKEKISLHQQGPPATRVRALLGWRPGTDLRACLKCRLQILCTKSLQEYPWPLESLSGFHSGPAGATRPSLKPSGLAREEGRGTGRGRKSETHTLAKCERLNQRGCRLNGAVRGETGSIRPARPGSVCARLSRKCLQQESKVALLSRNAAYFYEGGIPACR